MLPELNRDLLVRVIDHALSANNWRQDVLVMPDEVCGTTMCIAGFAAVEFAGWEPVASSFEEDLGFRRVQKGEITRSVWGVARSVLGLTSDEAFALFNGENTAEDVCEVRDQILNGEYRE